MREGPGIWLPAAKPASAGNPRRRDQPRATRPDEFSNSSITGEANTELSTVAGPEGRESAAVANPFHLEGWY